MAKKRNRKNGYNCFRAYGKHWKLFAERYSYIQCVHQKQVTGGIKSVYVRQQTTWQPNKTSGGGSVCSTVLSEVTISENTMQELKKAQLKSDILIWRKILKKRSHVILSSDKFKVVKYIFVNNCYITEQPFTFSDIDSELMELHKITELHSPMGYLILE